MREPAVSLRVSTVVGLTERRVHDWAAHGIHANHAEIVGVRIGGALKSKGYNLRKWSIETGPYSRTRGGWTVFAPPDHSSMELSDGVFHVSCIAAQESMQTRVITELSHLAGNSCAGERL